MKSRSKKVVILFLLVSLTVTTAFSYRERQPDTDIIVYGGGFAAVAAAVTAATSAPGAEITLVVPYPEKILGGIGTAGGQNFLDLRFWQGRFVARGSLHRWYQEVGRFYNTGQMAALLKREIDARPNISVFYARDVFAVDKKNGAVESITLRPVRRRPAGTLTVSGREKAMAARVYIDASESGRLARLAGVNTTVGRQDWPASLLPRDELHRPAARQQAATLMFKVSGVKTPPAPQNISGWQFVKDHTGSWGLVGGGQIFATDPVVKDFNRTFGPRGWALKPVNAAQNGAGSDQWWVNALLIFNVDGRAREMDRGTARFPANLPPESRTVDRAMAATRELIDRPEFIEALRRFKVWDEKSNQYLGFSEARLVRDTGGQPVTAHLMYIRETVHTVANPGVAGHGTEYNYALNPAACQKAGEGPGSGVDAGKYPQRVGLAHYFMDVNAYRYQDLLSGGEFKWPVTGRLRPRWTASGGQPENPVYLPYRMLTAPDINNLLLPGYATGASSMAWSEVRVLPNLAVLGDAAGAAASVSVAKGIPPAQLAAAEIKLVQQQLIRAGARLNK